MTRNLLFLSLLFIACYVQSQTRYSGYSWNTFPTEAKPDTIRSEDGSLILLDREIKEVFLNKEDIFEEIQVLHRKILVVNSSAINRNNKILIPTNNVLEIINVKARFIASNGKITEVPKESIRQIDNYENKGDYMTFAIEGAEVGGQIEYYFVLRKKFKAYGTVVKQDNQVRTNVDVLVVYPSKLEFILKSYNGFPSFNKFIDSTGITEQRATCHYIPSLNEERYSFYEAALQRYEYTLAYNRYNSVLRSYSWSKIADRFYELFYEINKKESSAVHDWLLAEKIDLSKSEPAIREIENHLKSEISIVESNEVDHPIDEVLKTKQANKQEIVRLFIALLNESGFEFNFVCTSNKESHPFDPDFNGWNFMDVYLIYFPKSGNYILPEEETHRYGSPPSEYQENYGIFFIPISFEDNLKTLGYEIRYIPAITRSMATDSLLINLQTKLPGLTLVTSTYRVFSGDIARNFQAWWHLWDEQRRKEVLKNIFNMSDPNVIITDYKLTHNSPEDIGLSPIIWEVNASVNNLMESAGENYLIKIGETIGEQSQLYQTSTRQLPVAVDVLRNYHRRIELLIPDGYHIDDISSLNMNVTMMDHDKVSCFFRSDASLKGNLLIITSEEKYTETYYPKEKFEEFRSVINAAADFNKKTILLSRN